MIVIGLVFLLPLLWLILASFNPHADDTLAIPHPFSLLNYHLVVHAGAGAAIRNSLYLAGVSTVIATAVSTWPDSCSPGGRSASRGSSSS